MNIDELGKRLDEELINVYKTVLVSGDWGIGKTFYLRKKYQRVCANIEVIFISLFGMKNISELNWQIVSAINKTFGNIKKVYNSVLAGQSIPIKFFNISLPVLNEDINKQIMKKAKNKKIIFVIDDIERKSPNIDMSELLGSIERIAKIENVYIIVVANESKIKEEDEKIFNSFKEKVINKTYNIDKFSKRAPDQIIDNMIGDDKIIKEQILKNVSELKITNLRILEKCLHFIKQNEKLIVKKELKKEYIEEIIKLQMIVVSEKLSQNYLKDEEDNKVEFYGFREKFIAYVCKKYADNNIYNQKANILLYLSKIYDDIDIVQNINEIIKIYEELSNPNIKNWKNIDPFYLSEDELKDTINEFINKNMNSVDENLNLYTWLKKLNYLYEFALILNIEDRFKDSDILNTIDLYAEKVDISRGLYSLLDDFFFAENKFPKNYINIAKEQLEKNYYIKKFLKVKGEIQNKIYNFDDVGSLISGVDSQNNSNLLINLKENEYFIPDLNARLTENEWKVSHIIWEKIENAKNKDDFIDIIKRKYEKANKIGKSRVEILNKKYNIVM